MAWMREDFESERILESTTHFFVNVLFAVLWVPEDCFKFTATVCLVVRSLRKNFKAALNREFAGLLIVTDGSHFLSSAVPTPDVPGQPDQQHAKRSCSQHQCSPHALRKQPLRCHQPRYHVSARGPGHYERADWWQYLRYYFFRLSRSHLGPTLSSAVILLPRTTACSRQDCFVVIPPLVLVITKRTNED